MIVEIRKAHDLVNIDVVDTVESLRALPLAFPVLRVGHRVCNLELFPAWQQTEPLDDAQLFAGGNGRDLANHRAKRVDDDKAGIAAFDFGDDTFQDRAKAMQMLKARLYEVELQKREAERLEAEASKTDIGWGHQIRSYVLQPYQMVKDLRTGVERSDPQKVLDGDLDEFMAASLAARVGEGKDKEAA